MVDPNVPSLEPSLSALFEAERVRTLAPAGSKDAAYARIAGKLALGAALGTAKHVPAKAALGSATSKAVTTVLVAFVVGGAVGSVVTASVLHELPQVPLPLATPSAAPLVQPVASSPETLELGPSLPSAAPASTAAPKPAPPISLERTLAEERRILDRAQMALTRGDPSTAIGATEEHRSRFPGGQLEAERETIFIQALVLAHRDEEARARAARFRARYPNSVFRRVVDLAVGVDEK
jgi:hypothetical protein